MVFGVRNGSTEGKTRTDVRGSRMLSWLWNANDIFEAAVGKSGTEDMQQECLS